MIQGRSFDRAMHIAALLVAFVLALPCAAQPDGAVADPARDFTDELHKFAKTKTGAIQPSYFAIVRHGLDMFDQLAPQSGQGSGTPGVDFAQLPTVPEAIDEDPRGQLLTSMRLGIRPDVDARVTNGWKAGRGQFDEAVMIIGNDFLCSGVALNPFTVLTAAHCACDMHLAQSDGVRDEDKTVWVGLSQDSQTPRFPIDVAKTVFMSRDLSGVAPCPNVMPSIIAGNPDLALVRLKEGSKMTVPTIGIASADLFDRSIGNHYFFIVGFGCTASIQSNGVFQSCRQSASGEKFAAVVGGSRNCASGGADGCSPGDREFILRDTQLAVDTCAGDSGGPVILFGDTGFFLAGITSRSLAPGGACGPGGIYENVSTPEVLNWLRRHVGL